MKFYLLFLFLMLFFTSSSCKEKQYNTYQGEYIFDGFENDGIRLYVIHDIDNHKAYIYLNDTLKYISTDKIVKVFNHRKKTIDLRGINSSYENSFLVKNLSQYLILSPKQYFETKTSKGFRVRNWTKRVFPDKKVRDTSKIENMVCKMPTHDHIDSIDFKKNHAFSLIKNYNDVKVTYSIKKEDSLFFLSIIQMQECDIEHSSFKIVETDSTININSYNSYKVNDFINIKNNLPFKRGTNIYELIDFSENEDFTHRSELNIICFLDNSCSTCKSLTEEILYLSKDFEKKDLSVTILNKANTTSEYPYKNSEFSKKMIDELNILTYPLIIYYEKSGNIISIHHTYNNGIRKNISNYLNTHLSIQ